MVATIEMKVVDVKGGGKGKNVVNALLEQVDDSGNKERERKGEKNREIKGEYCHDIILRKKQC